GGGFAAACRAGQLWCFIISDVIGDALNVIASGPTVADPTTFADAVGVLRRYRLLGIVPESVQSYLNDGTTGRHPETAKSVPPTIHNSVIGSIDVALRAAGEFAAKNGFKVVHLGGGIQGEARELVGSIPQL